MAKSHRGLPRQDRGRDARWLAAVVLWLAAACGAASAASTQEGDGQRSCPVLDGLYFVDAHSQMDQGVDEARVLSLMDHGGVYRTLLSNHLQRPAESLWAFAKREPERIIPMLRTKGEWGGHSSPSKWRALRDAELASAAYRGIAEALIWHQGEPQLGIKEVRIGIDDAFVRSAFDIARAHRWPFIAHIEFGSLEGGARARYMHDLEALVAGNPQLPVVMIHMGQLPPDEVMRLIGAHPNLYFATSHANPIFSRIDTVKRWQNLFAQHQIAPDWQPLFTAYPDRFLFALDNVFAGNWAPRPYLNQMKLWWCALSRLPADVAQAIAHGNAERLWGLPPKPASVRALNPWAAETVLGPVAGEAMSGKAARAADQQQKNKQSKAGLRPQKGKANQ